MKQRRCTTFGGFVWLMLIAAACEHWRGALMYGLPVIGLLLLVGWCMAQGKRAPQKDPLDEIMASWKDKGGEKP